jgi:hypothetical protein
VVALLRPRVGEEDVHAVERARGNHVAEDFRRIVLDDADVLDRPFLHELEEAADPGRMHLDRDVIVPGLAAAISAVVSPMPDPTSATTGALRAKCRSKSRHAFA